MEKIVEERIAGTRVVSMQVERALLEEFGHLLASQLETPDYHVRITHPLYLSEDSVVIPHLQIASDASEMPALIIEFFNVQSRLTTAARLRLYERHRIREYWAIDLDTLELDRYVLLEGYYLPRMPSICERTRSSLWSFPSCVLSPLLRAGRCMSRAICRHTIRRPSEANQELASSTIRRMASIDSAALPGRKWRTILLSSVRSGLISSVGMPRRAASTTGP